MAVRTCSFPPFYRDHIISRTDRRLRRNGRERRTRCPIPHRSGWRRPLPVVAPGRTIWRKVIFTVAREALIASTRASTKSIQGPTIFLTFFSPFFASPCFFLANSLFFVALRYADPAARTLSSSRDESASAATKTCCRAAFSRDPKSRRVCYATLPLP